MSAISDQIEAYHDSKIGLDDLTQFMVGFEFKVPEHIEKAPDDPNALLAFTEDQSYEQPDTWDEVNAMFNLGWLSRDDYHHVHQAVYDAHANGDKPEAGPEEEPEEKSGTRAGALLAWVRRRQHMFQDKLNAALQNRDPRAVARAQQGLAAWTRYRTQVEKILSNPNLGFKSTVAGVEDVVDDGLYEISERIKSLSEAALDGDDHASSILPDLQEEMLERLQVVAVDKSDVPEPEVDYDLLADNREQVMKSLRSGLGFNDLMVKFGPDKAAELWREFHVSQQEVVAIEEKSGPGLFQMLNQQTQLLQSMYDRLQTPIVVNSELVLDAEQFANVIREAVSPIINVHVPEQPPASIQVNVDTAPLIDAIKAMPTPTVNVHPTIALPASKTEVTQATLHRGTDGKLDGAVSVKTTTFEEIANELPE